MRRTGPDSLSSWMAVLYCSLISMLLYGVVGLSGVMFVASMDRFQVDRQSASFPYILCDFLQSMAGPVTGFLSLKLGARNVMALGSFIAALGVGTCFLAENIETVTILWGIVYGLGFGLSSLLLPAIITQHFIKRRATAISIVYVGSYVGFSFLPSIADLLIDIYGLSGTYLFLSAFLLHCVPLSMLLRNSNTGHAQKNSGIKRLRLDSISIISDYSQSTVKDAKCSLNGESLHDIQIRRSKTTDSQSGKYSDTMISDDMTQLKPKHQESYLKRRLSIDFSNCADLQSKQCDKNDVVLPNNSAKYQNGISGALKSSNIDKETNGINQITSDIRSQSCFGRINEGFSEEDLMQTDRKHRYTTESMKPITKLKNLEYQVECTKTTPKLLYLGRIGSSPSIFVKPASKRDYADILENIGKQDKYSNELLPVFVNRVQPGGRTEDELFLEQPVLSGSKKLENFHHSRKRRISTISKQEVTISKGLRIFLEPIFLLVLFSNAVYASSFIAFITVIVDLTIDIGMSESDGKFVIMVFSIASNIGLLCFSWVTDCGYLSLTNFSALMFFLRTATLCVIPFSTGFAMLMSVVALQGFFEASLANMSPLIVAEYYTDEIHELAISCTLFLSGPMHLGTPLLIGFFRDDLGSYLYLFLLMASLSLTCSLLHFVAPLLAKCRGSKDDWILRKSGS